MLVDRQDTRASNGVPDALSALEALQRELSRIGWPTWLQNGVPHPYLRVVDGHLTIEHVFVAVRDKPAYRWSNVARSHPLNDPAGAARRISADLAARHPRSASTRSGR